MRTAAFVRSFPSPWNGPTENFAPQLGSPRPGKGLPLRIPLVVLVLSIVCIRAVHANDATPLTANAAGQITISWTASGDDGGAGRATRYDLRRSSSPITSSNFASATAVTGVPAPQPAGTREYFTVSGLTVGNTYYFAMKVGDESNNWSTMSNVIQKVVNTTVAVDNDPALQLSFSRPMPNPAAGSTRFTLSLPSALDVRVEVFDVTGRRIRTLAEGNFGSGRHDVAWDLRDDHGNRVDAGMFMVRALAGGQTFHQRLVVMR
jgi:hypothetical protein